MKKLFVCLAFIGALLTSTPVLAAPEIPDHSEKFYVNDFANVLSDETENHIWQTSKKLDEETGAQIVVTSINNLDGRDIESYALEMGRQWKIGDNEKNSGLLILIATDDRRLRIEVGYGLEGILPDGKVGRLQDEHMVPALKKDKWDEATLQGYNAFHAVISENREEIGKGPAENEEDWFITLLVILFLTTPIWIIIIVIIYAKKHPEKFKNIKNNSDGKGGHSGGFGGGSSSDSGSSGGGGSFGGGGASRGF